MLIEKKAQLFGRYSTFQYPDQDAYQDAYPEDFNADALFHVSVFVKRICLCLPYYKQCLHNIVIIHMKMQCLFIHNVMNSNFLSYIRVIFQGYDVLGAVYGFDIKREHHCDFANLTQDNNLNNKDHF